ncbi:MAG: type II toxin-antitoxin system VapC family toxin [Gemmatimonadota bacterium]
MVIDTSALIAILFAEPESRRMVTAIVREQSRLLPAPAFMEASAVMIARKGPQGAIAIDALLQRLDIDVVGMSAEAAVLARDAYAHFGRGVGSPGVLNFGDCQCYGVSKSAGQPLLFKGDDFAATDVDAALY